MQSVINALFNNAALLLVLSIIYEVSYLVPSKYRRMQPVINGLLISLICAAIMRMPFTIQPGVIYDTRSILICVTALIFGSVPTLITVAVASIIRLGIGGAGTLPGLAVILSSALIGLAWRRWLYPKSRKLRWLSIYGMSVIVHVVMLACMLLLPYPNSLNIIREISLPVMVIYPIVSVLLSLLLMRQQDFRHTQNQLNQNLKDLLESQRIAHIGTWRLNLATNEVVWSEELYKMYGFDPTLPPPPYTEHMKLFTSESWIRLSTSLERTRTEGIPYELELKTVAIDGSEGWMWVRGEAEKDMEGNIIAIWGAAQDITEYKNYEFEIRESKERFQLLFNKAPLGYQSLDSEGRFIEVNQKWLDILGYDKDEVIGKWFGDYICPEYIDGFRNRFPIFKAQGFIYSEFEMLSKGGQRLTIAFEGKVGYGADGEFKQTHCILQDITDKRRAEKALVESEERYRFLFEYSGVGIGYYTAEGVVISFNKKALDNIGGRLDEYVGKSISDLFPKELADLLYARIKIAISSDEPQIYEDYLVLNPGPIWFSSTFTRVMNLNGEIMGVQIVSLDITERKKAENELIFLGYHDLLTGLYNRRFYENELKLIDIPSQLPLSFIVGDINGLKLINDSFGNSQGDKIIVETAKLLAACCREGDILARTGGDEFSILLPKTSALVAQERIRAIKSACEKYNQGIPNEINHVNLSLGTATKEKGDVDFVKVRNRAENIMNHRKLLEKTSSYSAIISSIKATMLEKSHETEEHAERIAHLSRKIGSILNLSQMELDQIELLATLHDIGKVGISERILRKHDNLDEDEWVEIKKHPEIGYRIAMSSPNLAPIANYILCHHERWDGDGYPQKLKGTEIPLISRIITIVDAFDAMTEDRVYRKTMTYEEAIEEIKNCSGTQFDPQIAQIFIETIQSKGSKF